MPTTPRAAPAIAFLIRRFEERHVKFCAVDAAPSRSAGSRSPAGKFPRSPSVALSCTALNLAVIAHVSIDHTGATIEAGNGARTKAIAHAGRSSWLSKRLERPDDRDAGHKPWVGWHRAKSGLCESCDIAHLLIRLARQASERDGQLGPTTTPHAAIAVAIDLDVLRQR